MEQKEKTESVLPDNVLLMHWMYYLQRLPRNVLIELLKDLTYVGFSTRSFQRLKKKRKLHIRKEIEWAFIENEEFQQSIYKTLKIYFCEECGEQREGYTWRYSRRSDTCTCPNRRS
jgi:hypothetical protein